MTFTAFITTEALLPHLDDPDWAIFDCRFDLSDPTLAERAYLEAHVPGAVYAHLERDLSAAPDGSNGRHPLPSIDEMQARFRRWGIQAQTQVVAYDARGGGFAARLWWMLRYLGHSAVAVLEGGFPAWQQAGLPTREGVEHRPASNFEAAPRPEMRLQPENILNMLGSTQLRVIDSRAPERYRGEEEPYDPIAGHIPGALNHFWGANLDEAGRLLPEDQLRADFKKVIGDADMDHVVFYCGSGVTACHNLLVLEHLGHAGARLYPGSWSEWIADPTHPVASGPQP